MTIHFLFSTINRKEPAEIRYPVCLLYEIKKFGFGWLILLRYGISITATFSKLYFKKCGSSIAK
jgi:hypothetical protein